MITKKIPGARKFPSPHTFSNGPFLTTLNVVGGFFVLSDVTMDISRGKFISGKSGHTHHVNFPR